MDTTSKKPVKSYYSVRELCSLLGISRALFYKLRQEGRGPNVIKLGKRTLITNEALQAWQRWLEKAA
jgi:excisionase family DNA binding protein